MAEVDVLCSDGKVVSVYRDFSPTLAAAGDLKAPGETVPLDTVDSETLLRCLDFREVTEEKEKEFFEQYDRDTLVKMVGAANYLQANVLMEAGAMYIASTLKGKTAKEICEIFGQPYVENPRN